jgi:2-keto-4-pentenoate hydratase
MSSPATRSLAADPRVRRGLDAQLDERRRRLATGERSVGWKLGFGSSEAMAQLGIEAPLVGYLVEGGRLASGARASISGWEKALVEPEVAIHVGRDIVAGGDREAVQEAIGGIGAAIELNDLDRPPDDVEAILRANVFQRHVVLGPASARVEPTGLVGRIAGPGGEERVVEDPQRATGEVVGLLRHLADLLGEFGETVRAGEVLICGSIVPPIAAAPRTEIAYRLDPLGEISIRLEP